MNLHPKLRISPLASAFVAIASCLVAVKSHAAFVTVPNGGAVSLSAAASGALGGNVLAFSETNFSDPSNVPNFSGLLRSIVVDADGAGPLTNLDFYYQVENISTGASATSGYEIFTFATQIGFPNTLTLQADYISSLGVLGGLALPGSFATAPSGTKSVDSAYWEFPVPGEFAGFNFVPGINGANSIDVGEVSNWLVFRTNANGFNSVLGAISYGLGGAEAQTFAPVPEPSTVLFGLAMVGVCAGGRFRKSARKNNS